MNRGPEDRRTGAHDVGIVTDARSEELKASFMKASFTVAN
jgi:hypothetical protein